MNYECLLQLLAKIYPDINDDCMFKFNKLEPTLSNDCDHHTFLHPPPPFVKGGGAGTGFQTGHVTLVGEQKGGNSMFCGSSVGGTC